MALIDPPLYLQADAHPARSFRALITETWDEGVMSLADMVVTQRAPGDGGPNFSVDISAGRCVIQGDSAVLQGNYMATNDAKRNETVTSAPTAGNHRYDIIGVEMKDDAEDTGGLNLARFRVLAGTPSLVSSGLPAEPTIPVSFMPLYRIGPITNSTTTITDAILLDRRPIAGRRATPGALEMYAGLAGRVPNGWLLCDGSAVSRTTYARLFAHIGTQFGVGNGTTTFNLPNFVGRIAIPVNAATAAIDTIGETGGAYTATLVAGNLPPHAHTFSGTTGVDYPDHAHPLDPPSTAVNGGWGPGGPDVQIGASAYKGVIGSGSGSTIFTVDIAPFNTAGAGLRHAHDFSGSTGNGPGASTPFSLLPPYTVVTGQLIRT